MSNSWQTVADHVKTTEFTVRDLRPNTVYLFIIRAVNAQGLGDPSPMSEPVRTQGTRQWIGGKFSGAEATISLFRPTHFFLSSPDISPTAQGVDHRRVQKELGDVVVTMHNPVVLSSTSVQVTWTVSCPLLSFCFYSSRPPSERRRAALVRACSRTFDTVCHFTLAFLARAGRPLWDSEQLVLRRFSTV